MLTVSPQDAASVDRSSELAAVAVDDWVVITPVTEADWGSWWAAPISAVGMSGGNFQFTFAGLPIGALPGIPGSPRAATIAFVRAVSGPQGEPGPAGPEGQEGDTGPAGPGVAAGGAVGQVLTKTSAADYDTVWANAFGTPTDLRSAGNGIADTTKTPGTYRIKASQLPLPSYYYAATVTDGVLVVLGDSSICVVQIFYAAASMQGAAAGTFIRQLVGGGTWRPWSPVEATGQVANFAAADTCIGVGAYIINGNQLLVVESHLLEGTATSGSRLIIQRLYGTTTAQWRRGTALFSTTTFTWSAWFDMVGPAGAPGTPGTPGVQGPTGPAGPPGPAAPIGASVMWHTDTIPTGWLIEDGRTLNYDDYPDLGAVFGAAVGGTFAIPDMRGMVPVGADGASFPAVGDLVGALTVTHSHSSAAHTHSVPGHTHSVPAHSHSLNDSGWAQIFFGSGAGNSRQRRLSGATSWSGGNNATVSDVGTASGSTTNGAALDGSTANSATLTTGTGGAGTSGSTTPDPTGSTSVSTVQPSRVVHFIIRALP